MLNACFHYSIVVPEKICLIHFLRQLRDFFVHFYCRIKINHLATSAQPEESESRGDRNNSLHAAEARDRRLER